MPAAQKNPLANPLVVLREEFDDWALLFDPDTGRTFGLNPTGVFVWKRLDGRRSAEDIASEIRDAFENAPDDTSGHVQEIVDHLVQNGLAGYPAGKG